MVGLIVPKKYGINFTNTKDPQKVIWNVFVMIHINIDNTDWFWKLHISDPQSVKVYRKSGRGNYLQKLWD